ncbi:MAG: alkaline phosphatase family protein [Thermoanaerobaculum sp.]
MKRRLRVLSCAVFLFAVFALSLVPPSASTRIVAVSRWSSKVRLLPNSWAFSPRFLASRVNVPQENGAAVLTGRLNVNLPTGTELELSARVSVLGAGPLPLDARDVRKKGLAASFGEALAHALGPKLAGSLWQATDEWSAWFPQHAVTKDQVHQALRSWLAPNEVTAVSFTASDSNVLKAEARAALRSLSQKRGRLVVLGLDALDWSLVDELCARGVMPHLAQLLKEGVHAELEVPPPLISPVIWTTIATGVPPEVHGVLDFLEPDTQGGPPHPISANSRKAPALWEILAAAGRSTATIGWWATFPAQAPPGGVVYSDRLTEQLLGLAADTPALADPPQAQEEAQKLALKAKDLKPQDLAPILAVTSSELAAVGEDNWDSPIAGLAKLWAATLTVERLAARELSAKREALFVYLEGTDTVGHLFAPYRAPALPNVDPALARRFGLVVDRYMAHVDGWIGQIRAQLKPQDTLIIVSDHGFTWGSDRPQVPSGAHTATAVWWHRPIGVFVAVSPYVTVPKSRQRMTLSQVAPTLLALAGLPSGAEMAGSLPPWVKPATEEKVHYGNLVGRPTPKKVELPPEARAEELSKLRALGYLGGDAGSASPAPATATKPQAQAPLRFDRAEARRLNNLASSLAAAGNRQHAEEVFRQAVAADPTYAAPHYNLATFLRKEGRFDEADAEFWRAVDTGIADPEMTIVRSALDYRERGQTQRAAQMFLEGLKRFPKSVSLLLNAGVFFGEQGQLPLARDLLTKAVELAPDNPKAHRNLAVALEALGDTAGALKHLEIVLQLDPSDKAAQAELSRLRRQGGVQ